MISNTFSKDSKVIIYIQEDEILADVTFPSPPMVVSLRDYDDAAAAPEHPIPGYPLVCITVSTVPRLKSQTPSSASDFSNLCFILAYLLVLQSQTSRLCQDRISVFQRRS